MNTNLKLIIPLYFVGMASLINAQNVGIGTTSPNARLNVEGNGASTEILRVSNDKNATKDSILVMSSKGNLGIGTTTPSTKLHISGPGDEEISIQSTAAGGRRWTFQSNGTTSVPSTFQIIDRTAAAARIGIDNEGDVGIGTTSPGGRLHVTGTLTPRVDYGIFSIGEANGNNNTQSGITFGYDASNNWGWIHSRTVGVTRRALNLNDGFYIHQNNNVGIGVTNPKSKLDVEGGVTIGASYSGTNDSPSNGLIVEGAVGIGTAIPSPSAQLQINSTTKGFLPPRLTEIQRNTISSPAEGLVISCINCIPPGLHQYIDGEWQALSTSIPSQIGNYGTVVNPVTGRVWLDRNLGASQVATSFTDTLSYGDLFQWNRGPDGHEKRTAGTTNTQATHWLAKGGNAWDGLYISHGTNWLNPAQTGLWRGTDSENNPCPSGFRVPSNGEWVQEMNTWTSLDDDGAFNSVLKLPKAGRRNTSGVIDQVGTHGYYYSCTDFSTSARRVNISSTSANIANASIFSIATSVRCIMD